MHTRRSLPPTPPASPVAVAFAFALDLPARACCTEHWTPTPTTSSPLGLLPPPDFRSPLLLPYLVPISWSNYCNNLVQHCSGHTNTQYPYGLRLGCPVGHREPSYFTSTSTSVPSHPIPSRPILSCPVPPCPVTIPLPSVALLSTQTKHYVHTHIDATSPFVDRRISPTRLPALRNPLTT